jgi:hypothetical protein
MNEKKESWLMGSDGRRVYAIHMTHFKSSHHTRALGTYEYS